MKEVIDLGFCPRCKEDLVGMMTRVVKGVKFCYLCSFEVEENVTDRQWIGWAKEYKLNMVCGMNEASEVSK